LLLVAQVEAATTEDSTFLLGLFSSCCLLLVATTENTLDSTERSRDLLALTRVLILHFFLILHLPDWLLWLIRGQFRSEDKGHLLV